MVRPLQVVNNIVTALLQLYKVKLLQTGQPPRVEKNLMQTLASQLSSTLVCIDQNL
jgi:hypothetical protein